MGLHDVGGVAIHQRGFLYLVYLTMNLAAPRQWKETSEICNPFWSIEAQKSISAPRRHALPISTPQDHYLRSVL